MGTAALMVLTVTALLWARRGAVASVFLISSVAFYFASASKKEFVWLIAVLALTFWGGRMLEASPRRRGWWLGTILFLLLGVLAAFKWRSGELVAPLGVSYITFRLASYLIDLYLGRAKVCTDPVSFTAYGAFFPQVSSGPIQRWSDFSDQLLAWQSPRHAELVGAFRLILWGLFKKLVVANRLALMVSPAFDFSDTASAGALVAAAYLFPVQLYADFSGLTDIARGCSKMLGIEAPQNFNLPFVAQSVQEFWSRWHMSLTAWLRDYLFSPLSLFLRRIRNWGAIAAITANMVAVGLWHGVSLGFLIFGLLNAAYMVIPILIRGGAASSRSGHNRWLGWVRIVGTFHLMMVAFVFFRANSIGAAANVLAAFPRLVADGAWAPKAGANVLGWFVLGVVILVMLLVEHLLARREARFWLSTPGAATVVRWLAYYLAFAAIVVLGDWETTTSIYQRF
jgi:D-alanyl-lipoteichoic acid acyltransferase DltB (MBOAT superfamily)